MRGCGSNQVMLFVYVFSTVYYVPGIHWLPKENFVTRCELSEKYIYEWTHFKHRHWWTMNYPLNVWGNLITASLLCGKTLLSQISGLLSYFFTIKTITEHLKPFLQEHCKVMNKKISPAAPVMLYFSEIDKATEPILELGRWKSAHQLLPIYFPVTSIDSPGCNTAFC